MDWQIFIGLFEKNSHLISFLGGLFAGEEVVATLAFMAAKGIMPLWVVVVFAGFGVFICDLFFYSIGRLHFFNSLKDIKKFSVFYDNFDSVILKVTKQKPVVALFYTKFIFGTRIITLIYTGMKKVSLKKFIVFDLLICFLWISIVVGIGYLAGRGYIFISEVLKNTFIGIGFVFTLIFIIFFVKKWIAKKLVNASGQ